MQTEPVYGLGLEPTMLTIDVLKGPAHHYTKERLLLPASKWLKSGFLPVSHVINSSKSLKNEGSAPMVSCFDPRTQLFVYLGTDPSATEVKVPLSFMQDHAVKVKQLLIRLRYPDPMEVKRTIKQEEDPLQRTKDRKISYIIEKVALWRNLYNGTVVVQGDRNKLTLEEASIQIGISKKSLDDYLLQLRFGRRNGFNFQAHSLERVGLLRSYVKRTKNLLQLIHDTTEVDELLTLLNKNLIEESGTELCINTECCRPTAKTILSRVVPDLQKLVAAHLAANSIL